MRTRYAVAVAALSALVVTSVAVSASGPATEPGQPPLGVTLACCGALPKPWVVRTRWQGIRRGVLITLFSGGKAITFTGDGMAKTTRGAVVEERTVWTKDCGHPGESDACGKRLFEHVTLAPRHVHLLIARGGRYPLVTFMGTPGNRRFVYNVATHKLT